VTLDRLTAMAARPTWVLDDHSAIVVDGEEVCIASTGHARYLP